MSSAATPSTSQAIKTGGLYLLGVPNRVNLRKPLSVPFGRGK